MALPIKETPILDEKQSEDFLSKVDKDLSEPIYPRVAAADLRQITQRALNDVNMWPE